MDQEVITKSWGSRIIGAFWGLLIGLVLITVSFVLIFWNESNGLHTEQSLRETEQVYVRADASPIDPNNNMRVVYFNGLATTNDTLQDTLFNISTKAIKLQRQVEMFQWEENTDTHTENETGGSEKEIITYSYKQVWSNKVINSNDFKSPAGHENPSKMAIEPTQHYAKNVTVGDFTLPKDLITQITGGTTIDLSKVDLTPLQIKINKPMHHEGNNIYVGTDPQSSRVGDLRVTLLKTEPQTVSIIAQQTQNSLEPYIAPAGKPVEILAMGLKSPQQLLNDAESENAMMTWILRLTSLVLMVVGIALIMRPIVILADFIPFLGSIVGLGTGFIAFAVGIILWSCTTAIAWFTVRPMISVGLILIAVLVCYSIYYRSKKTA